MFNSQAALRFVAAALLAALPVTAQSASWSDSFGNDDLGVDLAASASRTTTPSSGPFAGWVTRVSASACADGHLLNDEFEIAHARFYARSSGLYTTFGSLPTSSYGCVRVRLDGETVFSESWTGSANWNPAPQSVEVFDTDVERRFSLGLIRMTLRANATVGVDAGARLDFATSRAAIEVDGFADCSMEATGGSRLRIFLVCNLTASIGGDMPSARLDIEGQLDPTAYSLDVVVEVDDIDLDASITGRITGVGDVDESISDATIPGFTEVILDLDS